MKSGWQQSFWICGLGEILRLARVVQVFGSTRPHCAFLFANKRGNRMKVLIHDGLGIWLCARRLN
ncbi:IS66 family insertion sequence element accessory protein TnpB [Denitrificimonas caeni]|uniref:IS66 family insertion sequence element accessory protein TnpB n=1 Tax=Denitrificimonas caeni TaxID=521720 RepID=UPI001963DB52